MKFVFGNPYTFEGTEYKEVELDLESLTGTDISSVKREWTRKGNFSALATTDIDFCAFIAARAAKKPYEWVEQMPAKEYCKLAQEVSNFLML